MDGTKDKVSGKLKEVEGKVTGDKPREAQGKAESALGDVKNKIRDATENRGRDTKA